MRQLRSASFTPLAILLRWPAAQGVPTPRDAWSTERCWRGLQRCGRHACVDSGASSQDSGQEIWSSSKVACPTVPRIFRSHLKLAPTPLSTCPLGVLSPRPMRPPTIPEQRRPTRCANSDMACAPATSTAGTETVWHRKPRRGFRQRLRPGPAAGRHCHRPGRGGVDAEPADVAAQDLVQAARFSRRRPCCRRHRRRDRRHGRNDQRRRQARGRDRRHGRNDQRRRQHGAPTTGRNDSVGAARGTISGGVSSSGGVFNWGSLDRYWRLNRGLTGWKTLPWLNRSQHRRPSGAAQCGRNTAVRLGAERPRWQ